MLTTVKIAVLAPMPRRASAPPRGEAGILAQHPQAKAEVLHEVVPPEPAARFVEALLGPGDVAEGAPRRHASLFFAQTLLFQLLRLEFEMRLDFRSEVARLRFRQNIALTLPGVRRLWASGALGRTPARPARQVTRYA